ncbi:MAG TPA: hypothetical protein VMI56_20420 [Reyranella sp.]|nr:hypothetical protein [Reyranella sp.]
MTIALPGSPLVVEKPSGPRIRPFWWLIECSLRLFAVILKTGDESATMDRLFTSRHVRDLQLIMSAALATLLLLIALVVAYLVNREHWLHGQNWKTITDVLTIVAPIVAVLGAVIAWAYQAGSARLGVVDLFACEISTICRVTTVIDVARHQTGEYDQHSPAKPRDGGPASAPSRFSSEEDYFPVFQNNTRDLQSLEARVVASITAFYTYMKVFRDSLRARAGMEPTKPGQPDPWPEATRNLIFMLFLGLESGRLAITDLVEFKPENTEYRIVILISELEAYRFLRRHFTDPADIRHNRIELRKPKYRPLVDELCASVDAGMKKSPEQWEPARLLLGELKERCDAAIA